MKLRLVVKCAVFALLTASLSNCKKTENEAAAAPPEPQLPAEKPAQPDAAPGENNDILTGTPAEHYGALQVKGNKIVGKDGRSVVLRGMSLFWSQWEPEFYNEQAVKWLKDDWRCTVVRASMAVGVSEDGYLKNPAREKQKVIAVADAAIKEGIYVIIDWHDHSAESNTEAAKAFFTEMAEKYGSKPNVIYEIYNEPLNVSWSSVIKPYSLAVIEAIRKKDPDNLIICGTRNWSQQVLEAAEDPIKDVNVAYTLHFYAATHKVWLRDLAVKALDKGIALFVTEFGVSEASGNGVLNMTETNLWFDFMNKNRISYCNWSVADKTESSAALKPGAQGTGGWTDAQISESGKFLREHLRAKNPGK